MYLFFDTETTGLPRSWRAPVTDLDNWPRLVQLAWLLYDDEGNKVASADYIIKPQGFTISTQSSSIHGITTERAIDEGVSLRDVLDEFREVVEESNILVAHNISFDEKIMGAELLRNGMQNILSRKNKLCTMMSSVNYCAIPGQYGYKWPKLSELHLKLFGCDFEEAHNAAADINATAKCFWELKRIGEIY